MILELHKYNSRVTIFSERPTTTKSHINTLDLDLDSALTRASVALQMTFDLQDNIHHQTQNPCVRCERPLNGPEWTSHFTFIVSLFSRDRGSQCYVGPHV